MSKRAWIAAAVIVPVLAVGVFGYFWRKWAFQSDTIWPPAEWTRWHIVSGEP